MGLSRVKQKKKQFRTKSWGPPTFEDKKRKLRSKRIGNEYKEGMWFQGPKAGVEVGVGMYHKKENMATSLILQERQLK